MEIEIITKQDLEQFRIKLLEEIKLLLEEKQDTKKTKWLKSYQVMEMLGISKGTLQNLRVQGKIRFSKINGLTFYKQEDIEYLLKSNIENEDIFKRKV